MGQLAAVFGSQLTMVAIAFQVFELTRSSPQVVDQLAMVIAPALAGVLIAAPGVGDLLGALTTGGWGGSAARAGP